MFIEYEDLDNNLNLPGLELYRCRYRADQYTPDLFAHFRLAQPPGLQSWAVKRQAEFLAGRYCAARALARAGQAGHQVAVGPNREPLWPPGWRGAITHTQQHALAAVAASVEGVGIDLEAMMDTRQAAEFAPLILNASELALGRAAGLDLPPLVSLCFSLKESIFKALYPQVGRYFGFEAAELVSLDPAAGSWSARLTAPLTARLPAGFPLSGRLQLNATSVLTGVVLAQQ
ncbi:4'-phosphopantetheinyl transferase family protein [Duganella sp. S19_KUP01_CR8]|uniref:4'-phosphopantetheinyl transferase family protein n=1 Tax=Duganella sp. S19_KUP01_CR8 TaxID=3025502 RepID=UPI002FCDD8C1